MQVKNALISVSEHERLSGPAWLMGCFRLLFLKKPNINKKTTQKKVLNTTLPQQSHNPHPSSNFSFLVSLSQLPASTEKQQVTGKTTDCGHTLGPGAATALQSGWGSTAGTTAPPSNHQHLWDSEMTYFVTTPPLPGHAAHLQSQAGTATWQSWTCQACV